MRETHRPVLTTHGWATPSLPQSSKPTTHVPTDAVTTLHQHHGPAEGTSDYMALTATCGFACRTLLGEFLHVYVDLTLVTACHHHFEQILYMPT